MGRAAVLARALNASVPVFFDLMYDATCAFKGFVSSHPDAEGSWIRLVNYSDGAEWYLKVTSGRHGESRSALPVGDRIAATLELKAERTLWNRLRRIVQRLEQDRSGEADPPTRDEILRLKMATEAGERTFNRSYGEAALGPLRQGTSDVPINDRLAKFFEIAAELQYRRKLCIVDGDLFGGIAGCMTLIDTAMRRVSRDQLESCAAPLLEGAEVDPWKLLGELCTHFVELGLGDLVAEVAEDCRTRADRNVGRALDSSSIDEALDALYLALPMSTVAASALQLLASEGPRHLRARSSNAWILQDEKTTRIISSLMTQVRDLEGAEWTEHRTEILRARSSAGIRAAEEVATSLIEHQYIYPRALRPLLLTAAGS